MRFSSSIVLPALAVTAAAHNLHHNSRHAQLHNKRAGSPVITTGAKGLGDSQIHSRLEVSDLAANRPEQFALFIQAMTLFQEAASGNVSSYYSIAGIHGVPHQDFDGVSQCESCSGADGYCPHDSVLFPAWHRAYMALYEQEFIGFAYQAAYSYSGSQQQTMLEAASTIRFPYWDWAATPDSGSVLPTILSSPQVTYQGPNGQETIANPLYTFAIPDPSAMYYGPFTSWDSTLRWPNSNDADAASQDSSAVSSFDSIRSNMANSVYNLLTVCNDYLHFSNDEAGSDSTACTNSLEGIHNTIHTTAGGPGGNGVSGGHMTYLPLAAFDPVFWLHHCNVDRMFALWQTINPDSYGATQTAPHNTWTIASGSQQGPDSPLEPFRKDASDFWTTNDVRDWANTFSYTYPEFSTSDGSRSSIIGFVNQLYGSNPTLTASSVSENAEKNAEKNAAASSVASSSTTTTSSTTSSTTSAASSTTSSASSTPVNAVATGPSLLSGSSPLSSLVGAVEGTVSSIEAAVSSIEGSGKSSLSSVEGLVSSLIPKPTGSFLPLGLNPTRIASGVAGALSTGISGTLGGVAGALNSTLSSPLTNANGAEYQYTCNIQTPRYALNGSYYVYVFDGQPASTDASNYLTDKNLIGCVGVLGGGEMTANVSIAGSVPLTRYLQGKVQSGLLSSMSQNVTVPYLAQNLNWKIVAQGEEVHPSILGGFQAAVFSATSSPAGPNTLPVWSALQPQVQATHGKAGGLQSSAGLNTTSGATSCPSSSGNSTAPAYSPVGSKVPSGTPLAVPTTYATARPSPTSYTGAASKVSFGFAGVLAVAAFAAML